MYQVRKKEAGFIFPARKNEQLMGFSQAQAHTFWISLCKWNVEPQDPGKHFDEGLLFPTDSNFQSCSFPQRDLESYLLSP